MATLRKLHPSVDDDRTSDPDTPPPTQKPPSNNNGTANAPLERPLQRQQQNNTHSNNNCPPHGTTSNKENHVNYFTNPLDVLASSAPSPLANSNDGDGWLTVNSKGKGVPPPRQLSNIGNNNTSSSRSANSYASVAAANGVSNSGIILAELQKDFEGWPGLTPSVLFGILRQNKFDEKSTRRALLQMSGAIADNNKDSSAPSSAMENHLPAANNVFPKLQKKMGEKPKKKRKPLQNRQASASAPSSVTPGSTSSSCPKNDRKPKPRKSTLGDYLPSSIADAEDKKSKKKPGKLKKSRSREESSFAAATAAATAAAATTAGSSDSRPPSGNPAQKKKPRNRGGVPKQSHTGAFTAEEEKVVEDAIAKVNTKKERIFDEACHKYPTISPDILRRLLEISHYNVDFVQWVFDLGSKLDYDEALREHEELTKAMHNLPCYQENAFNDRREYIDHELSVLHPNNLPKFLWTVYTQAQGKCATPNWRRNAANLDGGTSILPNGKMEDCSSVQTTIAWSKPLPTTDFQYRNGGNLDQASKNDRGSLNFLVSNCVSNCPNSTYDGRAPPGDHHHCPDPLPNQITDMVNIHHLKFRYLLRVGYPVCFLNMGGSAVNGIMQLVVERLQNDESIPSYMLNMLCVIDSNRHMYKSAYCSEFYAVGTDAGLSALLKYSADVTEHARDMASKIEAFFIDVNCVRVSLGLDPIKCSDIFQRLADDESVAYIAPDGNAEAQKHMLETYKAQQSARCREGYNKSIGAASEEQRKEWTRGGGRSKAGMDIDAIGSLVNLLGDASDSAETFEDKVKAMSEVREITNIRNNPSIRWHFSASSQDFTFSSTSMAGGWTGAPSRLFIKVVPESSSDILQQVFVATTDVMKNDPVVKMRTWNEIESALVNMLDGDPPVSGRNNKCILVPGTKFTCTEDEKKKMKKLQEYADRHRRRVGEGKIALPSQYGGDEDKKLYAFVGSKSRPAKTEAKNEKNEFLLNQVKGMGFELGSFDPEKKSGKKKSEKKKSEKKKKK